MRKAERYKLLVEHFSTNMPQPETELHYTNPYELIVAVVLSAQCTDKRVNMVTPAIFQNYPTPQALAVATFDDLFPLVKSVSYPNNKTKHLMGLGKMLTEQFNGEVPATVDELQKLPGVGRKTANVVASVVFEQPKMAVDTHVYRVSHRLGLVNPKSTTPLKVELELVKHLPSHTIMHAHHWLILHGRYVCLARKPKCTECAITHFCKFYERLEKVKAMSEAKDSQIFLP